MSSIDVYPDGPQVIQSLHVSHVAQLGVQIGVETWQIDVGLGSGVGVGVGSIIVLQ